MALIKLTAVVDNISGKLNGSVFARNKGGHYIRSKSNPTNPKTIDQTDNRVRFGQLASEWRGLAEGTRRAWNNIAPDFPYQNRLGDTKILSGFSLFQKLNNNKRLAGATPTGLSLAPQAPVTFADPIDLTAIVSIDQDGDLAMVEYDTTLLGPIGDCSVLMYATAPMSKGISNFDNRLRLVSVADIPIQPGATRKFVITEDYEAKFGAPALGQKVGYAIRVVNKITGQASQLLKNTVEVSDVD